MKFEYNQKIRIKDEFMIRIKKEHPKYYPKGLLEIIEFLKENKGINEFYCLKGSIVDPSTNRRNLILGTRNKKYISIAPIVTHPYFSKFFEISKNNQLEFEF
jgi:hypothetical protein